MKVLLLYQKLYLFAKRSTNLSKDVLFCQKKYFSAIRSTFLSKGVHFSQKKYFSVNRSTFLLKEVLFFKNSIFLPKIVFSCQNRDFIDHKNKMLKIHNFSIGMKFNCHKCNIIPSIWLFFCLVRA